jgi:hypothetical protein
MTDPAARRAGAYWVRHEGDWTVLKRLCLIALSGAALVTTLSGCVVAPAPAKPGYMYDRDRDGVPNRYDRDRDSDGVPNRYDHRPYNPYRR